MRALSRGDAQEHLADAGIRPLALDGRGVSVEPWRGIVAEAAEAVALAGSFAALAESYSECAHHPLDCTCHGCDGCDYSTQAVEDWERS